MQLLHYQTGYLLVLLLLLSLGKTHAMNHPVNSATDQQSQDPCVPHYLLHGVRGVSGAVMIGAGSNYLRLMHRQQVTGVVDPRRALRNPSFRSLAIFLVASAIQQATNLASNPVVIKTVLRLKMRMRERYKPSCVDTGKKIEN